MRFVSLVVWLLLVLSLVGLFHGAMIGLFLFIIAYIKGNGIRLSEEQLPRVFRKVADAAERLEMKDLPTRGCSRTDRGKRKIITGGRKK